MRLLIVYFIQRGLFYSHYLKQVSHLIKRLLSSSLTVSALTLVSRILGFLRDMLIAHYFGVSSTTDAFFVAFKLPNFFRRLFTEGAFAHAFIPILLEHQTYNDHNTFKKFMNSTAGILLLILSTSLVISLLAAPLIISLIAPGFTWNSLQHTEATQLLRIMLPYLAFIVLIGFSGSLMTMHRQFVVPTLTPALLNISMIACTLYLTPYTSTPIKALAWGVFLGGILQIACQIPSLQRLNLLPKINLSCPDNKSIDMLRRLIPTIFSSSVTQINLLLDSFIASFLSAGSVSWLYYSDRLVELPVGLMGATLSTVLLPHLTHHHIHKHSLAFSDTLSAGLRLSLLISLPASIGLIFLAEPILITLFNYQEFTATDVHFTAQSLQAYALGLPAFIAIKVLITGFSARQDIKTPLRYGYYALGISLLLNILAWPFGHAGLALATSLGALINALLLLKKLLHDKLIAPKRSTYKFIIKLIISNVLMALGLYYGLEQPEWFTLAGNERIVYLIKFIFLGMIIYSLSVFLLGLTKTNLPKPLQQ